MGNPFQAGSGIVTGAGSSRVYNVQASTAAGDTLVALAVVNNNTTTVSALADSQGNVYTLDKSFTSAFPNLYAFRSPGATGGSGGGLTAALSSVTPDTWTLTTAAVSGNVELYVVDVGPVGALDQVSASIASGTSTTPTVSLTPAHNNETSVTMWGTANGGGAPTVNSPFTSLGSFTSGSNPYDTAAYDVLTGGSGVALTSTLTIVSANWRGLMWLFQQGVNTESGAFNITIPAPATTLAGKVVHQGGFALTLPAPAMALAGATQQTESGPLAIALPALATVLAGTVTNPSAAPVAADSGGVGVGGLAGMPGRGARQRHRWARRRLM